MTTSSAFTVSVTHNRIVYDVEITPTYNGTVIPGIDPSQWTLAERTDHIYSRTIQEMLTKSKITDDQLTGGLLTVTQGQGITFVDKTNINDPDTTEICDTFIRYLQQPASGIAESHPQALSAVDPSAADPIVGLGTSLRAQRNTYVNLNEDDKYDVRLSLFAKKCRELVGLPFDDYTPKELSCRAHLLQHRKVNPKDTADAKERLTLEINDWLTHKYLFQAVNPKEFDVNLLSKQEIAEIKLLEQKIAEIKRKPVPSEQDIVLLELAEQEIFEIKLTKQEIAELILAEENIDAIELERVEMASIGAQIKQEAKALKEAEAEAAAARARAASRAAEASDDELDIDSLTDSSGE